ncbi:MAG: glycosyltransferase family 39 protein [Acidobacteria bacterium]|nr:glycosyltransferase family 39 protein [Acidobacteriota bacterium]
MPLSSIPDVASSVEKGRNPRGAIRRWWAEARTSFFWMFAIGILLRVAYILFLHTYKFRTADDHFGFGWEMGRVGRAIASGRGFSDPFDGTTGPTAWEPPLCPYLIALVFRLFGIYSSISAIVLLVINSIFSALTAIPLFLIGRRSFGEKVAVWSAWFWILFPYVMYWSTRWVWETSLSALLMTLLFWLTLDFEISDGVERWARFGLLWAVAVLNSPVLVSFLPVSLGWAAHHRRRAGKPWMGGAALALVIFVACLLPWTMRNHRVFGRWFFVRDNFGEELRLGNGPGADGTWMYYLHPSSNVFALRQYRQYGETAYIELRRRQALSFITADPRRFAWLSTKRFIYYWAGPPRADVWWIAQTRNSLLLASSVLLFWGLGRALRSHKPGATLYLLLFLTFPDVYYVVFPHPRYRHPLEPLIFLLGIFLISEAEIRGRAIGQGSGTSQ